jgi:hypothetical protein
MANAKFINRDVPKDSKLGKYVEQLGDIIRSKNFTEDMSNFCVQLFHDSFAFVKKELKTDKNPDISVEFVCNQAEYEEIEKQANQLFYQKEKPKTPTHAFTVASNLGNKIYVNFEPHLKLLETNNFTFVFNLLNTLFHEIIHCFYQDSKDEQATFDLHYKLLEAFLDITLPDDKKGKATDYFT